MMCIDYEDGSVGIPCMGQDVLQAAKLAKDNHGRLRLVVNRDMSTTDPMVGCIQLGDWRRDGGVF